MPEGIIVDWRDPHAPRWSERWGYTVGLYGVIHPRTREVLYIGKADGCTVWERYNARDKRLRVWEPIEKERGIFEHRFIVGELRTTHGIRLTRELVSDIESLLINEIQPWANIQNTRSRRYRRPGMVVRCAGTWPHERRTFRDSASI